MMGSGLHMGLEGERRMREWRDRNDERRFVV